MRNIFLIALMANISCQPGEIMLTNLELELIDSISRVRSDALKQEIEDSCRVYREQVFDYLVDSIRRARENDILRLMETK